MPITTITFTHVYEDGDEEDFQLPAKFELCPKCKGKGSHMNPNIDGHGITSDEWERDWSEEEKESYRNGDYDVTCSKCNGEKVIKVVDEKAITPGMKPHYDAYVKQEQEKAAEVRQEKRDFEMGY